MLFAFGSLSGVLVLVFVSHCYVFVLMVRLFACS